MSETTLEPERIHCLKTYTVSAFEPSEFQAPLGEIRGLFESGNHRTISIVIDHTKRLKGTWTYKTLVVDDGQDFDIKTYMYIGTYARSKGGYTIKHLFYTIVDEHGEEGMWFLPR